MVPAGSGDPQHPLTSMQASPAGQSALVAQGGGVGQKNSSAKQTTFPSALGPQLHSAAPAPQPMVDGARQADVRVAGQVLLGKHEPAWQTWFAVQTAPRDPQLASSACRLTQIPF